MGLTPRGKVDGGQIRVETWERFWLNLRAGYDPETQKVRMGEHLEKEVRVPVARR